MDTRGALAAAGAAACFGVSVPLVQRAGAHVGAWWTAALLYAGAAIVAGDFARGGSLRGHRLRVILIAALGAAAAPALLAMGLHRIDAARASLLLGFEAAFTVLLARALYREPITKRLALALAFMLAGGVVLVRPMLASTSGSAVGAAFVLGAVLCWASDSAIMRPLSELPAGMVVRAKSLVGVALALAVALASHEDVPPPRAMLLLAACGAIGYGASLRLYLVAQRRVGAARTASVFSIAPFFGAVVALALPKMSTNERTELASLAASAALLALGVLLQTTEAYDHTA
jgi:drug/metabolite transporter (DMT)-like permease